MDDFNLDALDSVDFDSVEKASAEKQKERDKQADAEIESLREGADSCEGGACIL
jgi:hypothetical protein